MKSICVIAALGRKYQKLGLTAAKSFAKWHPEVPLYLLSDKDLGSFPWYDPERPYPPGVTKFLLAASMWQTYEEVHGEKVKCIVLGADTITCARLDEFLDNDGPDVLCTLDYPYALVYGKQVISPAERHVNADVVCFNSFRSLDRTIQSAHLHEVYHEQGALNALINATGSATTSLIVDSYDTADVLYNARAKGNVCGGKLQPIDYTTTFWIEDDKLFSPAFNDGKVIQGTRKQIKVWHHAQGFGHCSEELMKSELNLWANERFPASIRQFFVDHCDAGVFFNVPFMF